MHSSLNRLNHISSLATTYVLVLVALISLASYYTLPLVDVGRIEVKDLIVQRGRLSKWKLEDIASLRFNLRADLQPLLNSYNTKQLFLHLVASYDDVVPSASASASASDSDSASASGAVTQHHDVVLWDRIITRGDMRDFRAVGKKLKTGNGQARRRRGNLRVEEGKNKYSWKQPSGSFRHVPSANFTLHYSLMPYVGLLSTGVAATAHGPVDVPEVIKR